MNDLHAALQNSFGGRGVIKCNAHRITEITVCVSKELKVIDCPASQRDNCGNGDIFYPPVGSKAALRGASN